jgi:hypothetical protein
MDAIKTILTTALLAAALGITLQGCDDPRDPLNRRELRRKVLEQDTPYVEEHKAELKLDDVMHPEHQGIGVSYLIIMPASFELREAENEVDMIIEGLAPGKRDTVLFKVVHNSEKDIDNTKPRLVNAAENTSEPGLAARYLGHRIKEYLQGEQPSFTFRAWPQDTSYGKILQGKRQGDSLFLSIILEDRLHPYAVITTGHGRTTIHGFNTLMDEYKTEQDEFEVTWGAYFRRENWLDITCGSTSRVDPYSKFDPHRDRDTDDIDGLIRYAVQTASFVREGFTIKEDMKKEYERKTENSRRSSLNTNNTK